MRLRKCCTCVSQARKSATLDQRLACTQSVPGQATHRDRYARLQAVRAPLMRHSINCPRTHALYEDRLLAAHARVTQGAPSAHPRRAGAAVVYPPCGSRRVRCEQKRRAAHFASSLAETQMIRQCPPRSRSRSRSAAHLRCTHKRRRGGRGWRASGRAGGPLPSAHAHRCLRQPASAHWHHRMRAASSRLTCAASRAARSLVRARARRSLPYKLMLDATRTGVSRQDNTA